MRGSLVELERVATSVQGRQLSSEAVSLQAGGPGPWAEQYSLDSAVRECSP
jgi:hypothetical protein